VISIHRILILHLMIIILSSCSLFSEDDDELKPTELMDFKPSLPIKKLWSAEVGQGSEFLLLSLMPTSDGVHIFAASFNGNVVAYDSLTGKKIWSQNLGIQLSGGPGTNDMSLVVSGKNGELICLATDDGKELWRINIEGESVSQPLIKNDVVVVKTIDGKLRGFSILDGTELWLIEQQIPSLTLRGSSTPLIIGNNVISGFDNGRLISIRLDNGAVEWESMLSPPSGRTDLERLNDLDGSIASVGQDIYAASYQGRLASIAAESGQIIWDREISSYSGVSVDWDNIYTTTENGELVVMQRLNGDEVWRHDSLVRREPTTPVPFNSVVAVGDFEGYIHLFDNKNGAPVARVRVGKGMISGIPIVIGTRLYVQSESGDIAAFLMEQPESDSQQVDNNKREES